jgi:hypothetical protein
MRFRSLWLCAMLMVLCTAYQIPRAAAQAPRRWLADTALIGPVKSIGPTNQVATGNGISEMKLLDNKTGWAASYQGVLRFDGRFWRPDRTYTGPSSQTAVDLTATDVWIVGFDYYSGPPFISIARYSRDRWISYFDVIRRDGSTGPTIPPGRSATPMSRTPPASMIASDH